MLFSREPFNAPKEGESDETALSHYLVIALRGRPNHTWMLLLERQGSAAAPAPCGPLSTGSFLRIPRRSWLPL